MYIEIKDCCAQADRHSEAVYAVLSLVVYLVSDVITVTFLDCCYADEMIYISCLVAMM